MANETFTFQGDTAEYTGRTDIIHGRLFYEGIFLEGHRKGAATWTTQAPKAETVDASKDGGK